MTGYVRSAGGSGGLKTVVNYFIRTGSGTGGWKTVISGFVKVGSAWKQFISQTQAYTFYLGNTVYIGTNGYIAFGSGQSTFNISNTVGSVLGILPADLVTNSIRWAADGSKFYFFYRGRRFSSVTDYEIEYEVHFTSGQNYALIKLIAFPADTYDNTAYYVDGSRSGYSAITSARTVGAEYRVYFDATTAITTTFTEYGSSAAALWLATSTLTSGTLDDGYFTIAANQGASPSAPTSIASSNIAKTTATVSWGVPTDRGMSAIQTYDYSINSGATWVSTSTTTSVNLTGLTANTSYTVLVRANNFFFTGTNYASVTFTTTAGPVNITPPTLSTNTGNYSSGSVITVSPGTWTGTNSYKYEILYATTTPVATTSAFVPTNASNQYTITNVDATNVSYYFRAKVTGYDGAGQTGDSAIAYSIDTSPRSYIVPTTTISVGSPTSTGFTISGVAGPVSTTLRYVSISAIYIYNSAQTLIATITTGLPTVALTTGAWSYNWTGGATNTTYYAKVMVASTSTDINYFTTAFSSSITTANAPTITFSAITNTKVTATWSATNAAFGYKVTITEVTPAGNYKSDDAGTFYNGNFAIFTTSATFTRNPAAISFQVQPVVDSLGNVGQTTSRSISLPVTPTFGANTPTADGFTGSISNYDPTFTYFTSVSAGTLSINNSSGTFTVFGLAAGASATVSSFTTRNTAAAASFTSLSGTTTGSSIGFNPVVWGAMADPAFARNTANTSYRWGWNNQLPTSGDYTPTNITWEWQHSTTASTTGLLASGTRPNRQASGLTVGASTYNNRVSSLSTDYTVGGANDAGAGEPVAFSTASRFLRYRAVVVGSNGTTYRSAYSAWV